MPITFERSLSFRFSKGHHVYSCTVDGGGKVRKGKSKKKLEPRKAQSLEEAQLEIQQHHKNLAKQTLVRSQTFDSDRSFERTEGSIARSSFIKHNKTFHKLFPDIPESEDLIHAYICALQKEVPYHGRLYVSENYVCFYSSVLLKDTKVVIPVSRVHFLKKQNTALLVPNALSIRTNEGEKYLFVSLRNREACYKLLHSICPHLEEHRDGSTNSSPLFSSAEHSFDQSKHMNSSQSSLEDSFDQLDRGDSSLLLGSPPPRLTRDAVPHRSSTLRTYTRREKEDSSTEEDAGGSWVWTMAEGIRSHLIQRESCSLNTLLFIYLLLVVLLLLSSGYIGLRIVALEEQLTSLGALPEFSLPSRYNDT
ncbi:hypothetical protein MATL_G00030760 [Megalops atlanticus]|uniref:GRAM domain-containing protein n=1 Tax=Megalops atlanticus TaxID=7932 RepID=A0A9D3QIC0_MEGAT|nr:hypothetical protein MATL_G00030760 [Megalops atlanticus]